MKKVLIDCDPGIDDAVALLFAVRSAALDIKAITTVSGNLTADRCSANARRVLELVGRPEIPVAKGPLKPLVRQFPRDPFSHGNDGLADLGLPPSATAEHAAFAPDLIVETAAANAEEITLIALGPLTNVALALMRDPALPAKVRELVLIGGAYGFGNAGTLRATGDNPVSEWNIFVDPEAADIVFRAGFKLRAIGLDVVTRPDVELGCAHRDALSRSGSHAAAFLLGASAFVTQRGFGTYAALIDAAAIAYVLDPTVFTMQTVSVAIETVSPLCRGQIIVDRREHFRWTDLPTIDAACDIDATRYLDLLTSVL